jgi:hypothetical protein
VNKYLFKDLDLGSPLGDLGLSKSIKYKDFLNKLEKQKELRLKLKAKRVKMMNLVANVSNLKDQEEYF